MLWVLLFAAIALGGLVTVVCYAVWLAHKTSDILSEVAVLGRQAGQLGELLGEISRPPNPPGPDATRDLPVATEA